MGDAINIKAEDYGLHGICKGETKTHAYVRSEIFITQCCKGVYFPGFTIAFFGHYLLFFRCAAKVVKKNFKNLD
jgi:hypothetical protein